jgi:hypothetical protein
MTSNRRRWIHYGLLVAAIICSLASLFALLEVGAVRWTTPLNILSLLLIFLAIESKGPGSEVSPRIIIANHEAGE